MVIWQLAMIAHCFPMSQKSKEQRLRWDELKRTGRWPPPLLPALVPHLTLDADGAWVGPPDLDRHPLCEEIREWILDAMAEEHRFSRNYIWEEVDSDSSFK